MKIKLGLLLIPLIFVLILSGCSIYEVPETEEIDNTIIYIEKRLGVGDTWEFYSIPEGYIELVETDRIVHNNLQDLAPVAEYYWKFKSIKPGEFTLISLSYSSTGSFLNADDSYVEDYIIDENLKIRFKAIRPIYEIEKYDKQLFEQYTDQIKRNFVGRSYETDGFGGIWYSITGDYSTKTINLTINNNGYDESKLIEYTENIMDFLLNSYSSVSAQYNYTVVVE